MTAATKTIKLNKTASEIGLYTEVCEEISFEAGMPGRAVQAEVLNFQVYVFIVALDTPDQRFDKIAPNEVKLIDQEPHIKYGRKWYLLQGTAATSCDRGLLLPAIVVD